MVDQVNESFINAANALTALLRDSQQAVDQAYERGQSEAYTDVLNWMMEAQQGDLKYVSVTSLLQHLHKHLPSLKINSFPDSRKRLRDTRDVLVVRSSD
jgi:hypothetical protein